MCHTVVIKQSDLDDVADFLDRLVNQGCNAELATLERINEIAHEISQSTSDAAALGCNTVEIEVE